MARNFSLDVAVDLDALGKRLRSQGVEVSGDLVAHRVGRGQSNLTYVVTDRVGNEWIVRRPPHGELLASAHDVLREYRILHALQGTGVPVPRVVGSYKDEAIADTPVVVMDKVEGMVLDSVETAVALAPDMRAAIGPAMARALADIHRVDIDEVGLGDLASRSPYAARQLRRWSRQWNDSRTRKLPQLDEMTELLRRRIPKQLETRLVHGDFHIRNIIVDPVQGSVRAILDWELSTLGDPLADIGALLAYWPESGDGDTLLFEGISALPGFVSREEIAETYLEATSRSRRDLAYWHVLGLWKIAVILEGVLRRALDHPENAAEGGAPSPAMVESLIERAWIVAEDSGLSNH